MYQRNSCDTDTHYHNGRPYPRSHADSCSTYIRIHDTRWLDMCRYRNIFSVFNLKMNIRSGKEERAFCNHTQPLTQYKGQDEKLHTNPSYPCPLSRRHYCTLALAGLLTSSSEQARLPRKVFPVAYMYRIYIYNVYTAMSCACPKNGLTASGNVADFHCIPILARRHFHA